MKRWDCGAYAVIKIIFKAMDYLKNSLRLLLSIFSAISAPEIRTITMPHKGWRALLRCLLPAGFMTYRK